MTAKMIACTRCGAAYPSDSIPYLCPDCGGIYDFNDLPEYDEARLTVEPGLWRYRHTFGLPADAPMVYLGEGDTPLVPVQVFGRTVYFKLEYLNPTGSFKDRGTAVLTSFLRSRGVTVAVEDSSGNAGASFSAYAASAGIDARVFVPAYASGPKRAQIEAYGAHVDPIAGPRSHAADAVREAADQGLVYASHAYLPQGLAGFTTAAFELNAQLGQPPGVVIVPAGQGLLLLAMGRGFQMLQRAGHTMHLPKLIGVQAAACAPLWAEFTAGKAGLDQVQEGETLAEGVRIRYPHRPQVLIDLVRASGGQFVAVAEPAIALGEQALAQHGFYVEPTSAIVWDALAQLIDDLPDPIVVILTGTGLKSNQ